MPLAPAPYKAAILPIKPFLGLVRRPLHHVEARALTSSIRPGSRPLLFYGVLKRHECFHSIRDGFRGLIHIYPWLHHFSPFLRQLIRCFEDRCASSNRQDCKPQILVIAGIIWSRNQLQIDGNEPVAVADTERRNVDSLALVLAGTQARFRK
jgi:hypothetical protein